MLTVLPWNGDGHVSFVCHLGGGVSQPPEVCYRSPFVLGLQYTVKVPGR